MTATGVLLISCPDRPGIVAAVAAFVAEHGGKVIDLQQHTDHTDGAFYERAEFELRRFDLARAAIAGAFAPVADRFSMRWALRFSDVRRRLGLLASKEPHCLHDLLNRWRTGELPVDRPVVASNHPGHSDDAAWFGVPCHHLPIIDGDKAAQEAEIQQILVAAAVDTVVLARYMQILSRRSARRGPSRSSTSTTPSCRRSNARA